MSSITEHEVSEMLNHLSLFNKKILLKYRVRQYKVHLICELLYSTGLNIAEIASIKVDDLDFGNNVVIIDNKIAFYSPFISDLLQIYIRGIRTKDDGSDLLFSPKIFIDNFVEKYLSKLCRKHRLSKIESIDVSNVLSNHFKLLGCDHIYIDDIFFNNGVLKSPIAKLVYIYCKYNPRKYK